MKIILSLVILITCHTFSNAQSANAVTGKWKDEEGKAIFHIYEQNNKYLAKIIWLRDPTDEQGKPKTDKKHPDASVRGRSIMGMVIAWGFNYEAAKNSYNGGRIYDPESGKTYDCVMSLKNNNTLKIRGYVMGMTMLGRTTTWTRQPG